MDDLESLNLSQAKRRQRDILTNSVTYSGMALNKSMINAPPPVPNISTPHSPTNSQYLPQQYSGLPPNSPANRGSNPLASSQTYISHQNYPQQNLLSQYTFEARIEPDPAASHSIYSQLDLIKTISEHLDPLKTPKINIEELTKKRNFLLISLGKIQQYKEILTQLKDSIKCDKCLNSAPDGVFPCKHKFCRTCFFNSLGSQIVPPSSDEEPIHCEFCYINLNHSDYSCYFTDWEERIKLWERNERMLKKGLISCKGCFRKLTVKCFNRCRCYCFECLLNKQLFDKCSCGSISNCSVRCDVCSKKIETNYCEQFFIFCDGHIHCFNCMVSVSAGLACGLCKTPLKLCDSKKVLQNSFMKCMECNWKYTANYFLSNQCCSAKLCIICQSKRDNYACAICKNRFTHPVSDYLESMKLYK